LCTDYADFDRLNSIEPRLPTNTGNSNRLTTIGEIPRGFNTDIRNLRHPLTQQQLKDYGFDCWASDMIEGPSEALAWLFAESGLASIVRFHVFADLS
jgi:tRNA(Leu) C34 or U34 (ribose-2'-O)-methylase TrmL